MKIARANESHIYEISRLFDLYRQFYKCEEKATSILSNLPFEIGIPD